MNSVLNFKKSYGRYFANFLPILSLVFQRYETLQQAPVLICLIQLRRKMKSDLIHACALKTNLLLTISELAEISFKMAVFA